MTRRSRDARLGRSGGGMSRSGLGLRDASKVLQFVLLVGGAAWLVVRGAQSMGYNWQWYRVPPFFYRVIDGEIIWGPLLRGLVVTLEISVLGLVLTAAI